MDCLKKAHDLMLDPLHFELVALGARKEAAERLAEFTKTRLTELSAEEKQTVERAMRLDRYFTQPFVVAEDFTGLKGVAVSLKDTISGAKRILDGDFDSADLKDLTMKGGI